ncbi:ribosome maturation factor RimM [Mucilaginibacter sp. RS28]|uniref:Ribosome maturation factor RimM n=1 Tax=Mucilaginibacter straminoryzae TaxID=2932774 RepID=A0A9X1XBL9_9SPHI|nr:ribosome maturation factor RimM [Mucilaginibacter straminoryzae]MCJ8211744.1 ribosome maturation factor RimM [Mucilaginibacter straminoryzae]
MIKSEDTFRIGSLSKTRGLKGELQLYVDFDGLDDIKFDAVFIDVAGKLVPYFVKSVKYPMPNTAYINFEEVDTVEKAAKLVKKDVYLPNKLKPQKGEDDFTLFDLEGFIAIDEQLGELGEIIDVAEYPQQIIATVKYQGHDVLFPLNTATIKGIDLEGGEVYVDLPEGLLDVYLE